MIGVLRSGGTPRQAEYDDALFALKSLYRAAITAGTFCELRDVVPTGPYTAGENERVFRNSEAVTSITLPEFVAADTVQLDYGELSSTGTRLPRGGAVIVISDALTNQTSDFIFDGHHKRWLAVDGLTLNHEAPLSARDPAGLAAWLAVEISEQFGQQVGPVTQMQARRFLSGLAHNHSAADQPRARTDYI